MSSVCVTRYFHLFVVPPLPPTCFPKGLRTEIKLMSEFGMLPWEAPKMIFWREEVDLLTVRSVGSCGPLPQAGVLWARVLPGGTRLAGVCAGGLPRPLELFICRQLHPASVGVILHSVSWELAHRVRRRVPTPVTAAPAGLAGHGGSPG